MAAFPNVWSESVRSFHVLGLHKCTRFVSYFPAQCFHAPSCVIEGASERFHALVFFFYCSRLKDSFFDIICLRRDTLSPAAAGFLTSFENKHFRFDDDANHRRFFPLGAFVVSLNSFPSHAVSFRFCFVTVWFRVLSPSDAVIESE